jgi:hypothetical protein
VRFRKDSLSRSLKISTPGVTVHLRPESFLVADENEKNVREMPTRYIDVLGQREQKEEAEAMRRLLRD